VRELMDLLKYSYWIFAVIATVVIVLSGPSCTPPAPQCDPLNVYAVKTVDDTVWLSECVGDQRQVRPYIYKSGKWGIAPGWEER
jgi:hypothetical protein